jgi:hypothetical protein
MPDEKRTALLDLPAHLEGAIEKLHDLLVVIGCARGPRVAGLKGGFVRQISAGIGHRHRLTRGLAGRSNLNRRRAECSPPRAGRRRSETTASSPCRLSGPPLPGALGTSSTGAGQRVGVPTKWHTFPSGRRRP